MYFKQHFVFILTLLVIGSVKAEKSAMESIQEIVQERFGDGGSLISDFDWDKLALILEDLGLTWFKDLIDGSPFGDKLDQFIKKFEDQFNDILAKLENMGISDVLALIMDIIKTNLGPSNSSRKRRDVLNYEYELNARNGLLKSVYGDDTYVAELLNSPRQEHYLTGSESSGIVNEIRKIVEKLVILVQKFQSLIAASPMLVMEVNEFLKKLTSIVTGLDE